MLFAEGPRGVSGVMQGSDSEVGHWLTMKGLSLESV